MSAETLEQLWEDYDEYVESSGNAFTVKRYELAKRIAEVEQTEESERSVIDLYGYLPAEERNKITEAHMQYALGIQAKYPNSSMVQTALCWSALLQNIMPAAESACQRAYELDFMYAPSIANMGHIYYFKGDIARAESLFAQSLIANGQGSDWVGTVKSDFDTLPHIYTTDVQQTIMRFIDKELAQKWYTDYQSLDNQKEYDELAEEKVEKSLPLQQKMQQIISERFGKSSLINGYAISLVADYQQILNAKGDARKLYHQTLDIFKQNGITKDNSNLAAAISKQME